jgi:protein involved in polysaccharide export with SLBB domain
MTKKWMVCLLGCALGASLLAGCGTEKVPNQRVYDRYAAIMQERRQHQLAAQQAAATAAEPEKAPATKPAAKPAAKPAPAKPAPKPVAKPAPAPAPIPAPVEFVEPEPEPVFEEPAPAPAPVEIISAPEPEPEPEPAPEPEPEPESIPEYNGEEDWDEPEVAPAPAPAPVEVIPPDPESAAASHSDPAELSAYALRIGDGVAITLRGIPTPEKIECQVDEYGMIPLPLINDVKAEGLSAAELQKNIRQTYLDRGIYKNINVTVLIPTRYYYTQGEFKNQGKFQLVSAITLSQAIAASGYFTDFASGKVLIRRNGTIYKTVRNARKLDRTPEDDILIEPNDIIEAERSWW